MRKLVITSATLLVALVAFSLVFAPVRSALAGAGFNNADLKGEYSWKQTIYWNDTTQQVQPGVLLFSADGAGNYTIIDGAGFTVEQGTYVVNPNGMGFLGGGQTGFVLHSRGAGADMIRGLSNGIAAITLTKQ
jgi:hypothetical protein